ncbi:DinB family protein [Flammeovirga sp. MY04]|uniref:DinB family protein n=1 Tax=Flammeovirga sp. MY04 TaxID=1191459 RepID=UPI0008063F42|nr:DinB family protein [Flammeovirga sp. MY04]ANQ50254.1 DinB family protein [Flammeovirga sp. MY04]
MNHQVTHSAIELCAQLNDLLTQISDDQFSASLPLFSGASIGQHTRHIVEFYQCLLHSVTNNKNVCYEDRERSMPLESERSYAIQVLEELQQGLTIVDEYPSFIKLEVKDFDDDLNNKDWVSDSTVAREMHYCNEHTVHHLAIIKVGLNHYFPDVKLKEIFGVAKSTYAYRKGK